MRFRLCSACNERRRSHEQSSWQNHTRLAGGVLLEIDFIEINTYDHPFMAMKKTYSIPLIAFGNKGRQD